MSEPRATSPRGPSEHALHETPGTSPPHSPPAGQNPASSSVASEKQDTKVNVKHSSSDHPPSRDPQRVSSLASSQHMHEQELLSEYAVPKPPLATQESTLAAGISDTTDPGHHGDHSATTEAPRTLWMGDLDPWLDEAAIVDLWRDILAVEVQVKVIRPRVLRPGPSEVPIVSSAAHSGYCFVEFPSLEAAQTALGLNGQLLPDIAMPSQQRFGADPDNQKKYFRLNWASGATLSAPIVESPEFSLFVGDLSASTTEAHLLSFFQQSFPDSVKTVRVMTDPVSGKSRCFGFVRFSDECERQRALVEMNGVWFGGRPLRVAQATPRSCAPFRRPSFGRMPYGNPLYKSPYGAEASPMSPNELMYFQAGQAQGQSPMQGYFSAPPPVPAMHSDSHGNTSTNVINTNVSGVSGVLDASGNLASPSFDHTQAFQAPDFGPGPGPVDGLNTTVFVGGLSSDVTDHTLFTLFQPFGSIVQIKIPPGKNCGFVKYTTREEAEEAIMNMEGFVIGGHRVRLGWGRISSANKKYQRHKMTQMMSTGYDPGSIYSGYPVMPGQIPGQIPGQFPPHMQSPVSPNAGPGGQVYAPMAVQMRPPGMYPYAEYDHGSGQEFSQQYSQEYHTGYVQDPPQSYTQGYSQDYPQEYVEGYGQSGQNFAGFASGVPEPSPISRSRSLDHELEAFSHVGSSGGPVYGHDHLTQNFDTLSLDAVDQYPSQGHQGHRAHNPLASHGRIGPYGVNANPVEDQRKHESFSSLHRFRDRSSPASQQHESRSSPTIEDLRKNRSVGPGGSMIQGIVRNGSGNGNGKGSGEGGSSKQQSVLG